MSILNFLFYIYFVFLIIYVLIPIFLLNIFLYTSLNIFFLFIPVGFSVIYYLFNLQIY